VQGVLPHVIKLSREPKEWGVIIEDQVGNWTAALCKQMKMKVVVKVTLRK
jgi:hypothetical protein